MKSVLALLMPLFLLNFAASAAETSYMHIEGQFPQDATLSADLSKNFTAPLEALRGKIMFSYIVQTMGDGYFFLNLILSPRQAEDTQVFRDYILSKQKRGFRGMPVIFNNVIRVEGESHLLVGSYVDDDMDPFQQHFDMPRKISLADLSAWNDFSNEYGFAFLGSSEDFQNYLRKFSGDDSSYENLKPVLAQNNMAAMDARLNLILDNGATVGAAFEVSPFLPLRFFRNCYSAQHENGMCYADKP